MSQAIRVPYKAVNGVSIPTDIHFKPSAISHFDRKKAPVLLIFHGGGFAVGEASMNSSDQIEDCLDRGWIVLSAEYRLCPGVTALDGPVKDARDLLDWSQNGGLEATLQNVSSGISPDTERVMAMGTSAGGHLALSLVSSARNMQPHQAYSLCRHGMYQNRLLQSWISMGRRTSVTLSGPAPYRRLNRSSPRTYHADFVSKSNKR